MKSKNLILFIILFKFLFIKVIIAQTPLLLWEKTYYGSNAEYYHKINSIIETIDGGYFLIGMADQRSQYQGDLWLVKTDSYGDTIWQKQYTGPTQLEGKSVVQLYDNGYMILVQKSSMNAYDFYLLRINEMGDTLWTKKYFHSYYHIGTKIILTNDNNLIIAGRGSNLSNDEPEVCLIKTDIYGNIIWNKYIRLGYFTNLEDMIQTNDSHFLFVGMTVLNNEDYERTAFILKTDTLGNEIWRKYFINSQVENIRAICDTENNGYLATGNWISSQGYRYTWVGKFNSAGDSLWYKDLGTGRGLDVINIKSGGYYLLFSDFDSNRLAIHKLGKNGFLEWSQHYGNYRFEQAYKYNFIQTNNERIVIGGTCLKDDYDVSNPYMIQGGYLIKISEEGVTLPGFTTSVFQNPVITKYANIVVVSERKLINNPTVEITQYDDMSVVLEKKVNLSEISPNSNCYRGNFEFSNSGVYQILTKIEDDTGLPNQNTRTYNVLKLLPNKAGELYSIDKKSSLMIYTVNNTDETFYTACVEQTINGDDEYIYGPSIENENSYIVKFNDVLDNGQVIYQFIDSSWTIIPSQYDITKKVLSAKVHKIGKFKLKKVPEFNDSIVPEELNLFTAYPNPFNSTTTIKYALNSNGYVSIEIYNVLGELVMKLFSGYQSGGYHYINWNAENKIGQDLASGLYILRLNYNNISKFQKIILIK